MRRPTRNYVVARPLRTHWRPASCEEVACHDFVHGFMVERNALTGAQQHAVEHSGRPWTVQAGALAGQSFYVFVAGTPCFRHNSHRLPLDRPELYAVRSAGAVVRHTGADPWLNDFGGHLDRVRRVL